MERRLPPDIIMLFMHHLRNVSNRIQWNGHERGFYSIDKGVRQGEFSLLYFLNNTLMLF